MVKADPKRDYYADLGVSPDADADEIRKQFRKLALKWHPDRNPGSEAECVPKFQAIQAAQEILVDTEQRRQYDAARRKGSGFYTTASRTNVPTRGNPYQATSNFPPPPRRTQRPQPQQTRPEYNRASTASHGASRFSQFPKPPPTSQKPGFQDGPEKANVFNAWQNMNHNTKPKVPPRTQDTSARGKTAWEGVNKPQQQAGPGVGRSASTRTPRRGGFDPAVPGADEPPARGTSGYNSTRYSYRPVPPQPAYTDIPQDPTSANVDQFNQSKPQAFAETEVPYTEGSPRPRAPYNSTGGEKIFINRTASTRGTPQQPGTGSARSPFSGQFGSAARGRSASPPRRGGNATRPFAMYSSSDDDSVVEVPNPNRRADRASEPEPSRPQANGPTVANGQPQPNASVPNPAYTNGEMGQKKQSTMYGKQFPTSSTRYSVRDVPMFQSFFKKEESTQAKKPTVPYWAYPSTVMPLVSKSSTSPAASEKSKPAATGAQFGNSQPLREPASTLADLSTPTSSFTMPINHETFTANRHEQSRTRSTDSINTDFVSPDWHGKFEGKTDYFPPFGGPRPKDRGRNRSSPIRGKASGTTRLNTGTNGFSEYAVPQSQVPPPPPFPPPQQQQSSSSSEDAVPPRSTNIFSPEGWGNVFNNPEVFAPIPPQKPQSPSKVPPARRAKPPSRNSSTANPRPGGMKPKPATVSDDVPNGDSVDSNSGGSSSTLDSSAMDIDSVPQEPRARPARAVPVPVSQETWEKFKAQATMPPKSASQTSQGTDGADAIRMGDFQNVAPFSSTSQAGLKDLNDLGSTLPFESGASTAPPVRSDSPPPLSLPTPPRAPVAPMRLSKASWDEYRKRAAFYMNEWCRFDSMMLQHLAARQQTTEQLGSPLDWLSAVGESTRGGFRSYMDGQREDQRVRAHWNTANEQHLNEMGKFEEYRNKVLSLKGPLPPI